MKLILALILMITVMPAISQELQVKVSAGSESVNVSTEDDDAKMLSVKQSKTSDQNLTIKILNAEEDKEWKRNFSIYNNEDTELKEFIKMKDGSYCIKLKELSAILKSGETYSVYTTAIPKDPQKAMVVKMGRKLICKIEFIN